MVRQAEINKAADQRRKELIEARNQADQMAYVDRAEPEGPERHRSSEGDRRGLEQLIAEVRRTAQGEDVTAIRDAMQRLEQAASRMSQAAYAARRAAATAVMTATATAASLWRQPATAPRATMSSRASSGRCKPLLERALRASAAGAGKQLRTPAVLRSVSGGAAAACAASPFCDRARQAIVGRVTGMSKLALL